MARLALSVAGTILGSIFLPGVGTYFGLAISSALGGAIGGAVGSIIGAVAFPGKGIHQYGPRVNDLQVSGSAPGSVIPIIYGRMRVGGQIIWSTGLQEVTTTTSQSAKGTPSVTQTTYTYFCGFAAAFSQGPATVTRIWGDSKLIYDITGTNQIATGFQTYPTLYTGSETQLPDPFIVSKNGSSVTPAYRGTCYALWERMPLANFGNRIPNIRAEVTGNAEQATPGVKIPFNNTASAGHAFGFQTITSYDGHFAFVFSDPAGTNPTDYFVNKINLDTNETVATFQLDPSTCPSPFGAEWIASGGQAMYSPVTLAFACDINGDLWMPALFNGHAPTLIFVCYDGWTGKGKKAVASPIINSILASAPAGINTTYDGQYIVSFHNYTSGNAKLMLTIRVSDATVVGNYVMSVDPNPGDLFWQPQFYMQYPILDPKANAYFIANTQRSNSGGSYITYDWYIWKINMPSGVNNLAGGVYTNVTRYKYTGDNTTGKGYAALYDAGTDSLIIYTRNPDDSGNGIGCIHKIACSTMQITDTIGDATTPAYKWLVAGYQWKVAGPGVDTGIAPGMRARTNNGIFYAPDPAEISSTQKFISYNSSLLQFQARYDYTQWPIYTGHTMPGYCFDFYSNSLIGETLAADPSGTQFQTYRFYLDRLSTNGTSAGFIVSDLCSKAGIDDDDVDVSQIENLSIAGYPISTLSSGKDLINTLGAVLFFEGRESDFQLQFIPRGQPASTTVDESLLGMEQDKAKLTEMLGQEQDVPKEVELIYIEPALDYQQSKQHKVRHHLTKKTTLNKTSISVPVVLDALQAAQITDKILWTAENERHTYKTSFWQAWFMLLDPLDVINFNYNGVQLTARIVTQTIGQNFATAVELTAEDSFNYVSTQAGNPSTGFVPQIITGLARTLLVMLDIPYLSDTDADAAGNTGMYIAMAAATGGTWSAGVIYSSSDNAAFNQFDSSTQPFTYGIAQNILGVPVSVASWDNVNTLVVQMLNGTNPSSDTMLNVLNGANAAILVPSLEIIQFTTATLNGDGTYTLSGLLRGRRGTEGFAAPGNHVSSEMVIFPLQGGVIHEQLSLNLLNILRYYKGITVGADLNSATAQNFTVTGNDLKPYSPNYFNGTRNLPSANDWTLAWIRRTRLGGAWLDGTGSVPLAEDTEAYDVEILDSMGNVVRTFSNITPPGGITDSWTSPAYPHQVYTAAQQTADFGGVQTTIRARVYQLSAQVGRGFVTTLTVTFP